MNLFVGCLSHQDGLAFKGQGCSQFGHIGSRELSLLNFILKQRRLLSQVLKLFSKGSILSEWGEATIEKEADDAKAQVDECYEVASLSHTQ